MTLQISLSDGTTTLALPPDLEWQDEFDWTPVEHSTDYSNTGSLIVHEGERQDGRPITLFGGTDGHGCRGRTWSNSMPWHPYQRHSSRS